MTVTELSNLLDSKVKQLVEEAMHKYLGVTINEIEADISDAIKKGPLADYQVDTKILFKKSKLLFKKYYLTRLLKIHSGNISDASKSAKLSREALQRLVKELKINIKNLREDIVPKEYLREIEVQDVIKKTLESYKEAMHPEKFKEMYEYAPELSRNITKSVPEQWPSLKEAEREFETNYIKEALAKNNNNISQTAKKIGIRFETLHRKIKELEIK